MSTVNLIQDKSITYEVFKDGDRKLGTTEIALPSLEPKTSTLSGAGIGGEIEMPTPGQLGSTEVELTWRTITGNNTELMGMDAQDLELRNANETYDAGTGNQNQPAWILQERRPRQPEAFRSHRHKDHARGHIYQSINQRRAQNRNRQAELHSLCRWQRLYGRRKIGPGTVR